MIPNEPTVINTFQLRLTDLNDKSSALDQVEVKSRRIVSLAALNPTANEGEFGSSLLVDSDNRPLCDVGVKEQWQVIDSEDDEMT